MCDAEKFKGPEKLVQICQKMPAILTCLENIGW